MKLTGDYLNDALNGHCEVLICGILPLLKTYTMNFPSCFSSALIPEFYKYSYRQRIRVYIYRLSGAKFDMKNSGNNLNGKAAKGGYYTDKNLSEVLIYRLSDNVFGPPPVD
jgi:hypothetical protein